MWESFEVLTLVIPCAVMFLAVGLLIGRAMTLRNLPRRLHEDREQVIQAMQAVLESTHQLRADVDTHNSELVTVEKEVCGVSAAEELESARQSLLHRINTVVTSNKRLEDDLVVTRYKLEEKAQELDKTRAEARTDFLSGLGNRKSFDETFQFVLSQYKRKQAPFALLLSDVDGFKQLNDTHGHQAGDQVISQLGERLGQLCRGHDIITRYGGDEFALILRQIDSAEALRVAKRISEGVAHEEFELSPGRGTVAITMSIGVALPQPHDTMETLFARADQALYQAKAKGHNQVQACQATPQGENPRAPDLEAV